MGVLFFTDEARARIDTIRRFAALHVWDGTTTIDDARHSVVVGTYVAKFTHTRLSGTVCRHLSVACYPHRTERLPNRIIVQEIAIAFGFREPYTGQWGVCDCGCNALQILQPVDP